jgi:hypothetical protein
VGHRADVLSVALSDASAADDREFNFAQLMPLPFRVLSFRF